MSTPSHRSTRLARRCVDASRLMPVALLFTLLVACYGGPFEPVLFEVCDGHLEAGRNTQTQVANVGSDAAELIDFDEAIVVDLDDEASGFVTATRMEDGRLLLDARAVGVGYVKLHIEAPDAEPSWAWFLLDVRDGPSSAAADCWTSVCRRTYQTSRSR